jgi:hypothetical protein
MGVTLHIEKDKNLSGPFREALDRSLEVQTQAGIPVSGGQASQKVGIVVLPLLPFS